jgi:hypothetical protein
VVLLVSFGKVRNGGTEYLSFDVVEMYYPYNDILGRGFLNKFEAVIHQVYLCMKIPVTLGVITIWGHQNDIRNLNQTVIIRSDLSHDEEGSLVQFHQKNKDVCAWSTKDLTGVDRSFIEH